MIFESNDGTVKTFVNGNPTRDFPVGTSFRTISKTLADEAGLRSYRVSIGGREVEIESDLDARAAAEDSVSVEAAHTKGL